MRGEGAARARQGLRGSVVRALVGMGCAAAAAASASGAVQAHGAQVWVRAPVWIGDASRAVRLQLGVETASSVFAGQLEASHQDRWGWQLAVSWPGVEGGEAEQPGGGRPADRVGLSVGLLGLRLDRAPEGAGEPAGPVSPAQEWFSGSGTGWTLQAWLRRPLQARHPQPDRPGARAGGRWLHLYARGSWLDASGPATAVLAGSGGATGWQEQEAGHGALVQRQAGLGLVVELARPEAQASSRWAAGLGVGYSHHGGGWDYQGSFARWVGGLPVAAGARHHASSHALQAVTLTAGLRWDRGPVGLALGAGYLVGSWSHEGTWTQQQAPSAAPEGGAYRTGGAVRGRHLWLELSVAAGERLRYRLAAGQAMLEGVASGEGSPPAAGPGDPSGPAWLTLPAPPGGAPFLSPADGRWQWVAAVVLEL